MIFEKRIAGLIHWLWSHWMEHIFFVSEKNNDGSITIDKYLVKRWKRQMRTPYRLLSKMEQESDLKLARKFIKMFMFNYNK